MSKICPSPGVSSRPLTPEELVEEWLPTYTDEEVVAGLKRMFEELQKPPPVDAKPLVIESLAFTMEVVTFENTRKLPRYKK